MFRVRSRGYLDPVAALGRGKGGADGGVVGGDGERGGLGGGDGQEIAGDVMKGQAAAAQAAINYTRQNEYEADRIGISTLSRAGYDPAGMGEFFEKMARITRAMGEGPSEFLRTHPVSVSRIAEAENRAASMPTPETGEGREFYLAQARLRVLTAKSPDEALEWFDHRKGRADVSEAELDAIDGTPVR